MLRKYNKSYLQGCICMTVYARHEMLGLTCDSINIFVGVTARYQGSVSISSLTNK